ncbi:MAG: hypothetical protein L0Z62_22615 [Gemmataceae bacterium]|nr:hypothetical protein [Gemmataceae bacterium]
MLIDHTTPRHQFAVDQLPRGFLPFPDRVVQAVEQLEHRVGQQLSDEQRREQLEKETLAYFYADLHVAYRSAEGGIEVLGVGWDEAAPHSSTSNNGVKVIRV